MIALVDRSAGKQGNVESGKVTERGGKGGSQVHEKKNDSRRVKEVMRLRESAERVGGLQHGAFRGQM